MKKFYAALFFPFHSKIVHLFLPFLPGVLSLRASPSPTQRFSFNFLQLSQSLPPSPRFSSNQFLFLVDGHALVRTPHRNGFCLLPNLFEWVTRYLEPAVRETVRSPVIRARVLFPFFFFLRGVSPFGHPLTDYFLTDVIFRGFFVGPPRIRVVELFPPFRIFSSLRFRGSGFV